MRVTIFALQDHLPTVAETAHNGRLTPSEREPRQFTEQDSAYSVDSNLTSRITLTNRCGENDVMLRIRDK